MSPFLVWTYAERTAILMELAKPISRCVATGFMQKRDHAYARAWHYAVDRRAFFPAVWLQLLWGMRPQEACLLVVQDWNPRTGLLSIPARIAAAGQERRFLVDRVTADLLQALTNGRGQDDILLRRACGRPWNRKVMARIFSQVLRRLRVRGSLYSLRCEAIATLLAMMPVADVKRITGEFFLEMSDPFGFERGNAGRGDAVPGSGDGTTDHPATGRVPEERLSESSDDVVGMKP